MQARPAIIRFWEFVDADPAPGACWEWAGNRARNGYGSFKYRSYHQARAHRWIYEHLYGPQGARYVLHRCDNRACVRPSHLFDGTQSENIRQAVERGRHFTPFRKP